MAHPNDMLPVRPARTLLHGLGAAALTLLAFGVGPVVGLTARALPVTEVVMGPVEGAPEGTFDASFLLALADAGDASDAPTEGEVDTEAVAGAAPEEPAPEPAPAAEASDGPMPTARPDRVAAAPKDAEAEEMSLLEQVVAGKRIDKRPRGKRCEVERDNPKIQGDQRGRFTVDRSLVNWYITHLGELNRLGWSSKHEGPDGRSVGMRIGGVRCGNDLHLAGIRSGDVVHRVNGHEVRSIPQAIMVYHKVRKDPVIRVDLTRRGKPVTLTYRLS